VRAADKDDVSYSDFVTRLVRAQWQAKQEGALEWRIQRGNLPDGLIDDVRIYNRALSAAEIQARASITSSSIRASISRINSTTLILKIPLAGIAMKMIEAGGTLEARVPGTGRDGSPNCATVKPFDGWRIKRQRTILRWSMQKFALQLLCDLLDLRC
jgi:hypothetical protein